jgi:CelD/BcsL family acetyltransferase involved in cellulose biosynthesis
VIQTALKWLSTAYGEWDELYARAIEASVAEIYRDAGRHAGLTTRMTDTCPYYYVDLDSIRTSGTDYLSQLSRNTRYQVRRAIKGYSSAGPVRVRIAETLDEAQVFFDRLTDLHQEYWVEKGEPGAFGDEFRQSFHSRLIESRFAHGEVHLVEVSAPDQVIGFLYNFCYRGTVSNYQSGLSYSQDPKLKPGLVAHTMAIQNYLKGEQHAYDFLMGNHRYKRSLADCEGRMGKLVLQRPRLRFRAENALRHLRDRIRSD